MYPDHKKKNLSHKETLQRGPFWDLAVQDSRLFRLFGNIWLVKAKL